MTLIMGHWIFFPGNSRYFSLDE